MDPNYTISHVLHTIIFIYILFIFQSVVMRTSIPYRAAQNSLATLVLTTTLLPAPIPPTATCPPWSSHTNFTPHQHQTRTLHHSLVWPVIRTLNRRIYQILQTLIKIQQLRRLQEIYPCYL